MAPGHSQTGRQRSLRLVAGAEQRGTPLLNSFEQEILPGMRTEIHLSHAIRPGVDGYPAPAIHPLTYLSVDRLFDLEFRAGLEDSLAPVYTLLVQKAAPLRKELRGRAIQALALFAFARLRSDWLYSIAMREIEREDAENGVIALAAWFAAWEGRKAASQWFQRRLPRDDAYLELALKAIGVRGPHSNAPTQSGEEAGQGVRRLLWLDAAASGDRSTEDYVIRRSTKNPPVDPEELFDLYVQLLSRGRIFRAARLLHRRNRSMGAVSASIAELAWLFLSDKRPAAALKMLKMAPPEDRSRFAGLVAVASSLVAADSSSHRRLLASAGQGGALRSLERALEKGGNDAAAPWLVASLIGPAHSPDFAAQAAALIRGRGWDAQAAALSLPWTIEGQRLDGAATRACALLCGSSLFARALTAAQLADRAPDQAVALFPRGGLPERQHLIAEAFAAAGLLTEAGRLYRPLLRRSPRSAVLLRNAALLERAQGNAVLAGELENQAAQAEAGGEV